MPLKHATETLLMFLLAVLILLAGGLLRFLPPMANAGTLWALGFALVVLYPLFLLPLFRRRRADYIFRFLHFLPAVMFLVWLALEVVQSYGYDAAPVQRTITWGYMLPLVVVNFFLLGAYAVRVLRQRATRVVALLLLLVPFSAVAVLGEQRGWNDRVVYLLQRGEWRQLTGSGSPISGKILANLLPSEDSDEERWRVKLRRMERRERRIAAQQGEERSSAESMIAAAEAASARSARIALDIGEVESRSVERSTALGSLVEPPPRLPPSGPLSEAVAIFLLAGYCALLQNRAHMRILG
jgi:hypothetical protein